MIKQLGIPILLLLMISSAHATEGKNYLHAWRDFASKNKWGTSEDYWLETDTAWGWEKVSLVMGYGNDWEACEEIKGFWMRQYPAAKYRCIPANEK